MSMNSFRYISIFSSLSLLVSVGLNQEVPNEFYEFKIQKIKLDHGIDWPRNTTFGPYRFSHNDKKSDSLKINTRIGANLYNNKKSIYAYCHFTFNTHFHGYLYPRIVSQPEDYNRYSGIPRDISRSGFSSGETDLSGISYENDWMIIQFGRGRQSWGAGNDIQLALSEESNAYDYGMLDLDFRALKVRYFHGYLETDTLSINRYITGRGIEWNNQSNMLIGLSEIIIYSGKNRPIDFSYFNPISTHLEIEMNDRQNNVGTSSGNGIWQISIDYLPFHKFRLSGNYLFDEFTLDSQQTQNGKGSGRAHSVRFAYAIIKDESTRASIYFSNISVGTNTFKHQIGKNNFVQRNKPLGWSKGSDTREIQIGFNGNFRHRLLLNIGLGNRIKGEKNILDDSYTGYSDYLSEPFPSGDVDDINYAFTKIQWWWKPNLSIVSEIIYENSIFSGQYFTINLGLDLFYGIKTHI